MPLHRRVRRAAIIAAVGALTALSLPNLATAAPATKVSGGETQPTFSYADAIRETTYVESPVDGDHDGRPDRVAADVIRPKESDAGLKVPVIMVASPYFARYPVPIPDKDKRAKAKLTPAGDDDYKDVDDDGSPAKFPDWYDNYFVPRGYAVVLVDVPGTRASEGCLTSGGSTETLGVKSVVDWLGGKGKAFDHAGAAVSADWTDGKVGMVGRSWRGTEPNAVATMDVPNLKTIVPISAISSWYDYMRLDGQVRFADYPRDLASRVGSARKTDPGECKPVWDSLAADSAEDTGNYNAFWDERNYVKDVSKVKASVFMVHGLNDWNVLARNGQQFWDGLKANNVPRKLWLHQEAHTDPFNVRNTEWVKQLHHWFDYWLKGVDNGVMSEPQVDVERAPDQWATYSSWPQGGSQRLYLNSDGSSPTRLTPVAPRPPGLGTEVRITDSINQTESQLIANPRKVNPNRVVALGEPLKADTRISGVPTISLTADFSSGGGPLTALLVDYGTGTRVKHSADNGEIGVVPTGKTVCVGEGNAVDTGCLAEFKHDVATTDAEVVAEGWTNSQHRESLTRTSEVKPGQAYGLTWKLQPEDYVFKAGHRIGLVIAATDCTAMPDGCAAAADGKDPWPRVATDIHVNQTSITLPIAP
ncbi:Xaa-Pro dipeptidyl-peptidase [Amycolatopsis minnesotensis]|uniref:Xaa-Pro dipeptidyl-peptidase n=1 Tax=Amycolatopsis minnesotensis TaxID=337894 RepID=A0ABP5BJ32_9PSEU